MELGQRIKEKRKAEKMSAESLALKLGLGLSKDNIYKWERGSKPSDPEQYQKLMDWLENGKSQNGIDSKNAPVSDFKPQGGQDLKDEVISLLKELNELRKSGEQERANSATLRELKEMVEDNFALLSSVRLAVARILLNQEKGSLRVLTKRETADLLLIAGKLDKAAADVLNEKSETDSKNSK